MSFGRIVHVGGICPVFRLISNRPMDRSTTPKAAGCDRVFTESMSGTRADRPQLAEALAFMRPGDVLVVVRLDRLAPVTHPERPQRRGEG